MKKLQKVLLNNASLYIYGIFLVFVLAWVISAIIGNGNFIFPDPIETFKAFGILLGSPYIWKSIGMSLLRTLMGFGIGFAIAFILSFIVGTFKKMQVVLKPLFVVLKSAPTAAFVFLFILLLGSQYAPIAIAALLSLPILYEAFVGGMNSLPEGLEMAMRLDSKSKINNFFKVRLPIAFPYVLVGLASSFALSLKTTIMAEIIVGSTNYGLGSAINLYRNENPGDMRMIFGIALIAIFIIMLFDLANHFIKKAFSR